MFGLGSLTRVQYPKCAYDPFLLIKSEWYIHLSRSLFLYSMRKVKASHNSAQVRHLYESYFLLLKRPVLSEVQGYSLLKHQLRFFQRVWWSIWLRKIFQRVLCPTHLFQWKGIYTFNQTCIRYKNFQQTSIQFFFVSSQFVQNVVALTHFFFNMCHTWKTRLNT